MALWPLCAAFFLNVILGLISAKGRRTPIRTLVKAKMPLRFVQNQVISQPETQFHFILHHTVFSMGHMGIATFLAEGERRQTEMSIMKHAKMGTSFMFFFVGPIAHITFIPFLMLPRMAF